MSWGLVAILLRQRGLPKRDGELRPDIFLLVRLLFIRAVFDCALDAKCLGGVDTDDGYR